MKLPRTVLASFLALTTLASTASVAAASTQPKASSTIVIGNEGFGESYIMQGIYGLLLKHAGYNVSYLAQASTTRQDEIPALESGKVDLVPDYAGSLLLYLNSKATSQAGTLSGALKADNTILNKKGATALAGTSGLDQNVFVVTQATKNKYHLTTLSSLAAVAKNFVLWAPPECTQNYSCKPGLKAVYGINFKQVKAYDEGGPLTVAAVKNGSAQVGELFSTESTISSNKFYELKDNKNLEPADHLIPVVRTANDSSKLSGALAKVNPLLTTSVLVSLDAALNGSSHPSPMTVAQGFLTSEKLI